MRITHYRAFNDEKIQKALSLLSPTKREAIKSIPIFLHFPIKAPFIAAHATTPCGIFDYEISTDDLENFNRFWGTHVSMKTHLPEIITIESLIAIGSFGTVAFKETSDIDYWVVVRDDTDILALTEKCTSLELVYKQRFDLEIHFFVMKCVDVVQNNFGTVDDESAGSSLAALLKEEFYRTSTYFAGKFPQWYLDGDEVTSEAERTIDLGEITDFTTEELYGAAIWQLLKGTKSPMKSIVKLSLIYMLLHRLQNLVWPAKDYKTLLETSSGFKDPHIFFYHSILVFYYGQTTGKIPPLSNLGDLDMGKAIPEYAAIRRYYITAIAIYLSVHPLFRKKLILDEIFPSIPFTHDFLKKLDNYDNWAINEYLLLNNHTTEFIFSIYQSIRSSLKTDKKIISDKDLTVISRKLASHLLRKKNKIMNYSILPIQPNEKIFIINEMKKGYALFKNNVHDNNMLFISESPIAVAAWMLTNNFSFETIQLRINSPSGKINKKTFEFIMQKTERFLKSLHQPRTSDFLSEPYYVSIFVFVNFFNTEGDLLHDTQMLIYTSWGELLEFTSFNDSEKYIFEHILPHVRPQTNILVDFIDMYHHRTELEQRIQYFFASLKRLYSATTQSALYIGETGKNFLILSRQHSVIKCGSTTSLSTVFSLLGSFDIKNKKSIEISPVSTDLLLISALYTHTPLGEVCLFLADNPPAGVLFIVDENRTLFTRYFKKEQELDILYRYSMIVKNTTHAPSKIYRIIRDAVTLRAQDMTERYAVLMHSPPKKYIPISLHCHDNAYSFTLPKQNVTTSKTNISELKKHVSPQDPPFITAVTSDTPFSTAEILFTINTIEKLLES